MTKKGNAVLDSSIEKLINCGWAAIDTPVIKDELLQKCYAEWAEFFRGSDREKYRAVNDQLDGYFPMNTEKAVGADAPDPKEFFHFYRDGQCPPLCKATTADLFERITEIAVSKFSQLAEELPVLRNFTEAIGSSNRLVLRISRYFGETSEYFNAPHEDIDFITILPRATKKGLEVLENGVWKGAMVEPNQGLVLCGEMLTEATCGQVKPLRHRVISSPGERYSMSYFMNPDDEVQLSPQWKAGPMLKHRIQEIYS